MLVHQFTGHKETFHDHQQHGRAQVTNEHSAPSLALPTAVNAAATQLSMSTINSRSCCKEK